MTDHELRTGTTVARPAKQGQTSSIILPAIVRSIPGDGTGLTVNVEQAVRGETYSTDGIWVGISTRNPNAPNAVVERPIFHGMASDFTPFVWPAGTDTTRWTPFVWLLWLADCYFVVADLQRLFFGTADPNAQIGSCEAQS